MVIFMFLYSFTFSIYTILFFKFNYSCFFIFISNFNYLLNFSLCNKALGLASLSNSVIIIYFFVYILRSSLDYRMVYVYNATIADSSNLICKFLVCRKCICLWLVRARVAVMELVLLFLARKSYGNVFYP